MSDKLDEIASKISNRQTERDLEMYGAEKSDYYGLTPQEKTDLLNRLRRQMQYQGMHNMLKPSDQGNVS